jgi:prepilin-type N-terminal cleavage/methylation domain-containing protein
MVQPTARTTSPVLSGREITHRSRRAFSLLEMVISIFIVSLLLGLAIVATRSALADEELKSTARQLALMAKTARQEALLGNRAFEVFFEPGQWTLRPVEEKSEETVIDDASVEEVEFEPVVYHPPASVLLKIRRWGGQDWEKNPEQSWYFSATGLCAPHTYRLERGDSWFQMIFNPLNANIQEEEWYLP